MVNQMIIFSGHHQKTLILMTRYIEKYLNNENLNNENVNNENFKLCFHYLFVYETHKKNIQTPRTIIYNIIQFFLFYYLFIYVYIIIYTFFLTTFLTTGFGSSDAGASST
jgi:hypothetical protein